MDEENNKKPIYPQNFSKFEKVLDRDPNYFNKLFKQISNLEGRCGYDLSDRMETFIGNLDNFLNYKHQIQKKSKQIINKAMLNMYEMADSFQNISKCQDIMITQIKKINKLSQPDFDFNLSYEYNEIVGYQFAELGRVFNQMILLINGTFIRTIREDKHVIQELKKQIREKAELKASFLKYQQEAMGKVEKNILRAPELEAIKQILDQIKIFNGHFGLNILNHFKITDQIQKKFEIQDMIKFCIEMESKWELLRDLFVHSKSQINKTDQELFDIENYIQHFQRQQG